MENSTLESIANVLSFDVKSSILVELSPLFKEHFVFCMSTIVIHECSHMAGDVMSSSIISI